MGIRFSNGLFFCEQSIYLLSVAVLFAAVDSDGIIGWDEKFWIENWLLLLVSRLRLRNEKKKMHDLNNF